LQGRQIIWAWLQEHPSPVTHDYAGCISLPRELLLGVKQRRSTPPPAGSTAGGGGASTSTSTSTTAPPAAAAAAATPAAGGASTSDASASNTPAPAPAPAPALPEYFLIQRPLPELEGLRSGRGLRLKGIVLPHGQPW
jgi:hypothetical protein